MYNELTNVLPVAYGVALRKQYFVRLIVVALALVALLSVAAAALLYPVHHYLTAKIAADEAELNAIISKQESPEDSAFEARLTALTQNAGRITTLTKAFSVSQTLTSVLAIPHAGVTVSALSVTAPGKGAGQVVITGVARTRETLRTYQLAFENAPFVAAASLPVSVYAKDKDIPFTLTLSLTTP